MATTENLPSTTATEQGIEIKMGEIGGFVGGRRMRGGGSYGEDRHEWGGGTGKL